MTSFRIEIASPPDRERLVANVFVDDEQIAELNREDVKGPVLVELYPRRDGEPWRVNLDELVRAIAEAKARLLDRG